MTREFQKVDAQSPVHKVKIKTPMGIYPLEKFDFEKGTDFSILKQITDTSKSKYFKEQKEFLKKLKSDYR